MVTIILVEGNRDLYFFQNILVAFKNSCPVEPYDCIDANSAYRYYMIDRERRERKKTIVRSNKDYAILVSCNNKNNAIKIFIQSIDMFLRSDNSVVKLLLVVDQDSTQDFIDTISGKIQSLKTNFPTEPFRLKSFQTSNSLHSTTISRKSKEIQLGVVEVKPSLESILARFLRDYSRIPKAQIAGNEHETIRLACQHLGLEEQELYAHLARNYKNQLKTEMIRADLKHSICYMMGRTQLE